MIVPSGSREAKVAIPGHTCPVKLKTLNLELGRCILEVVTGSRIFWVIQKPVNGIDIDPHVNGVGFEPMCSRGGEEANFADFLKKVLTSEQRARDAATRQPALQRGGQAL